MIEVGGVEWRQAAPVNRIPSESGGKLEYRYRFADVHVDDVPQDVETDVDDAYLWWEDDELFYQYGDYPIVLVKENGGYCKEHINSMQAEQQVYYALSILYSNGYVGAFMKR